MKTLPLIVLMLLVLLSMLSPHTQAAIKPPIARAGADLTVNEQTTVTLDGATSSAPNSSISRYQWTQSAGKPVVTLTNATTASATFTAPPTVKATKLSFKLTITDSNGKLASDTVVVTVKPVNTAPIADAGTDRYYGKGVAAKLDGSHSQDSDGSIKQYLWQQTAGPRVKLTAAKSAAATFTTPSRLTAPVALVFKLTVTDNEKAKASDTCTLNIKLVNAAPNANAGSDSSVKAQATVTLDGSLSADTDGTIASYVWTQTAGASVTLSNPTSAKPSFTAPTVTANTDLSFQLTVTDNDGTTASDTVTVQVKPTFAPTANAGDDQTVKEQATVTLDGSLSQDPDGSIARYEWTQTAGASVSLSNPATAKPSFSAPTVTEASAFSFKLTVTDNDGKTADDTVTITVLPNQAPTKPQLIGVSSTSGDSITAEWLPAQDDLTSHANLLYALHISDIQGFAPSTSTEQTRQKGIVNATINTLQPGTLYYVKLTATDAQGLQAWSNELSITTASVIAHTTPATVQIQQASQAPQVTDTSVTYTNSAAPKVGDIIASAEGRSYFRKVIGVQKQGDQVLANTADASLNEVFDSLEINTTIKLDAIPNTVQAAKGLAKKTISSASPLGNSQTSLAWRQTGLTITDPNPRMGRAPAMQAAPVAAAANISINNDQQTVKGRYVDVTGRAFLGFSPGELGKIDLSAHIARPKTDFFNNNVPLQICAIKFVGLSHKDAAKRAIIAQDQAAGDGLQIGTTLTRDVEQSATLTSVWQVQEKYVHDGGLPYTASFQVIVDEKADGCAGTLSNAWAESQTIDIPIYITMGNLPSNETKSLTYSQDFTVISRNTFSAQPKFEIAARIEYAQLQQATLAVTADLEFVQDLQIVANGTGKLDQTLDLLAPRKFVKVFVAGGIPVVVSGEFAITLRVQGRATGKLNLGETLKYAFPNARFGLQYQNGEWREINEFNPDYQFTVTGAGEAGADLTLTLIPDLKIHFYDAASGRMMLLPYLYTKANIHGQFQFQDTNGNFLTDLDYWFTDLQGGGGLDLKLYAGLHIFDYNIATYPKHITINDTDQFKCLTIIGKSGLGSGCAADNGIPIASIPELTVASEPRKRPPAEQNSCALSIKGSYNNVANPFKKLFGIGPDAFISFANWNDPKIVSDSPGASILKNPGSDGQYWLHYREPGSYEVRLHGYSTLGWAINQVAQPQPFMVTLTDQDQDGMVDQWETLWGVAAPDADPDMDGATNLQEYRACTVPVLALGRLNDTGITGCGVYRADNQYFSGDNNINCNGPVPENATVPPGQDALYGRDVTDYDNTDGHAGFSFTKLDANGNPLTAVAAQWRCVQDNVTGLVWQIKTNDGGLHDQSRQYSWYEPDNSRNGGFVGYENCTNGICNTHAYVQAVNAEGYCGHQDWRLPTRQELLGIVNYDRFNPAIDTRYFPDVQNGNRLFWSSSPNADFSYYAWYVDFGYGSSFSDDKYDDYYVRLVR